MRAEDLAAHPRGLVTPLAIDYRGYTLHELPPNGQGIVALNRTPASRSTSISPRSRSDGTDSLHLQIEAMKLAFADARRYVGDLDYMDVRPQQLLGPGYLKSRAALIDMKRAQGLRPRHAAQGRHGVPSPRPMPPA